MSKKPIDTTEAPADSTNEATEGAQKLKLSVKRMKKLRSSIKGGASSPSETWASVTSPTSDPTPGTGGGWTNNAEVQK
jgi:hypothetical protein